VGRYHYAADAITGAAVALAAFALSAVLIWVWRMEFACSPTRIRRRRSRGAKPSARPPARACPVLEAGAGFLVYRRSAD
jgi:hypothetical protein